MSNEDLELLYCTRCGSYLAESVAVWLELNTNTGLFHKAGSVEETESQGCFVFGKACAKATLKASGRVRCCAEKK